MNQLASEKAGRVFATAAVLVVAGWIVMATILVATMILPVPDEHHVVGFRGTAMFILIAIPLLIVMLGNLVLWVGMFASLMLDKDPITWKILWGAVILFGLTLGAFIYYVSVYRTVHRRRAVPA